MSDSEASSEQAEVSEDWREKDRKARALYDRLKAKSLELPVRGCWWSDLKPTLQEPWQDNQPVEPFAEPSDLTSVVTD